MKAKDLRIGNIVHYKPEEICKMVNAIDGHDIMLMTEKPGYLELHKPIPITEEWLLKVGFIKEETMLVLRKNGFTIEFDILGEIIDCYLERIGIDIEFIHQLQNLYFALTGEELISNTLQP